MEWGDYNLPCALHCLIRVHPRREEFVFISFEEI